MRGILSSMETQWLIGIDEAGRGPLAGPVSVGVVCIPAAFDWALIPGVNDSKKLSEKKREEIFALTRRLKQEKKLDYAVVMTSAKVIDRIGIVPAVQKAMRRALHKLAVAPAHCLVKLDGSLKAPKEYLNQETIIGGDGKEKVIGLASIMAKVTRDRYMVRISKSNLYAPYDFAAHKGYGTKTHCKSIQTFGLSVIHRKSYCTKLIV